jgi:transcriptional regulator with XRE-family HTH domain
MTGDSARSVEEWIARVRVRIAALGLSQAEVEHRAGLSEGHLGAVLRGKRANPRLETALRIDEVLTRAEAESAHTE